MWLLGLELKTLGRIATDPFLQSVTQLSLPMTYQDMALATFKYHYGTRVSQLYLCVSRGWPTKLYFVPSTRCRLETYRTDEAGVMPGVPQGFDKLVASFHRKVTSVTLGAEQIDVVWNKSQSEAGPKNSRQHGPQTRTAPHQWAGGVAFDISHSTPYMIDFIFHSFGNLYQCCIGSDLDLTTTLCWCCLELSWISLGVIASFPSLAPLIAQTGQSPNRN